MHGKASVTQTTRDIGCTPLYITVDERHTDIVKFMVASAHADVNQAIPDGARSSWQPKRGITTSSSI